MPTSYDPTSHLLLTPEDRDAPARVRRLRDLGLGEDSVAEFDEFARGLAEMTGAPYAMVNFVSEQRQFFAGLHTPAGDPPVRPARHSAVGRVLTRDYGFCPHVVVRRKALVLEDVRDYPRFAGNPMVDEMGIRSYLGAPLPDVSGMALGTVSVIATEPRPWGRQGLETIKTMAAELAERIQRREPDI